ncbi:MAG: ATPase, T2SS/T4P/T4SS family [Anaerovoracaceae bacterium]
MKLSSEVWNLTDESFGPLLPYIKDINVTDINYNGSDVWIEDLNRGRYKATVTDPATGKVVPLELSSDFVRQLCTRIANVVSQAFNKYDNLLEAETDTLRVSIIHNSVARTGISISIRKTPAIRRLTAERILSENYCSPEILRFLVNCILGKMNMVFCGLPGTGKTELLKFLTQYISYDQKVITIEDNLEIHYRDINPGSNCVELKVNDEQFDYTKAIKASLRQNPQWVILSEARSREVKYLLEAFSTGLHGLTTIHTDDTRKIPDRIKNMMQDSYAASHLENDVYTFFNIGVLLRKRVEPDGAVRRFIDQICIFDRDNEMNTKNLIVDGGRIISRNLPANIKKKFLFENIRDPFGAIDY